MMFIKNFIRKVRNSRRSCAEEGNGGMLGTGEHRRIREDVSSHFNIRPQVQRDPATAEYIVHSQFPRPNLATVLIIILLTLVFLILPVFYLFHCFDILNTGAGRSYKVITDHSHTHPMEDIKMQAVHTRVIEKSMKSHSHLDDRRYWGNDHLNILKSESDAGQNALLQGSQINFPKQRYEGERVIFPQAQNNSDSTTSRSVEMKHSKKDMKFDSFSNTGKVFKPSSYNKPRTWPSASEEECSSIPEASRFDCHPDDNPTKESCRKRKCCWLIPSGIKDKVNNTAQHIPLNVPYCFYPHRYLPYSLINMTRSSLGITAFIEREFYSAFPNVIKILKIDFRYERKNILHFKIYDPSNMRFEPPYPETPMGGRMMRIEDTEYGIDMDLPVFGFKIYRRKDNTTLFNTRNAGSLEFNNQFLQLSSFLPSHNIYGLGEHQSSLKLSTNWQRFVMFNADQPPVENTNLYGSHPFYMVMEESGNSHGVFLRNSNLMEVILQPAPAITFRTLGGVLDFFVFIGPTPADVVKQYTYLVGRPFMPPRWSLGFHLSRYGYDGLNETMQVWKRTRKAKIPYDVQWNDLDYMSHNNDFTYNKTSFGGLPEFVDELHQVGMHYVPLIDPGVSAGEPRGSYAPYDDGMKWHIFVKNSSGQPFVGKVWNPISTVWPDFSHPRVIDYWLDQLWHMHNEFLYDGAWIDMNEPSNFLSGTEKGCENNLFNFPPYLPPVNGDKIYYHTLCMDANHFIGRHYDVHNIYGLSEAIATNFVLSEIRGERPFVISRSTFPGHGRYAGHWSGDIQSSWYDMAKTIPAILSFSLFGVPMTGADICGFNGNTTIPLCERWMELGAFYPFSRNHNSDGQLSQDPVSLGSAVVDAARNALLVRYSLLPYLYTLFWQAHVEGTTVARPLFIEFPKDNVTYDIDYEFLWGADLLIVPVLEENSTFVTAYFPKSLWYDFYSGMLWTHGNVHLTVKAPMDTIPLFLRGGSIIPMQVPAMTTTEQKHSPFELLISYDENFMAKGILYWDDGDTLHTYEDQQYSLISFFVEKDRLTSNVTFYGYKQSMILDKVTVLGVPGPITSVTANGIGRPFNYNDYRKILAVPNLEVPLDDKFYMRWVGK